jgi:hypothetical protein
MRWKKDEDLMNRNLNKHPATSQIAFVRSKKNLLRGKEVSKSFSFFFIRKKSKNVPQM